MQRQRWCRGGVQLLFLRNGPLGPGLDLMKRLLFFPIYWLVQLPAILLLALMPSLSLDRCSAAARRLRWMTS